MTKGATATVTTEVRVTYTVELTGRRGQRYEAFLNSALRLLNVRRVGTDDWQGLVRRGPLRDRLEQRAVAAVRQAPAAMVLQRAAVCVPEEVADPDPPPPEDLP